MTRRLFLFTAWCLVMLGGAVASTLTAWSPFADDEREQHSGPSGPSHK
ncbi:hypothetical protein [Novosphingobium sp. NBM11]|nr:hypothetical protein [Novosphingobium sp. NBM11]